MGCRAAHVNPSSPEREQQLNELYLWAHANRRKAVDYRMRKGYLPEPARGIGAAESNVDQLVANRFKKRGRGWTIRGAHRLTQVLNHRNLGRLALHRPVESLAAEMIRLCNAAPRTRIEDNLGLPVSGLPSTATLLKWGANGRSVTKLLRNITAGGFHLLWLDTHEPPAPVDGFSARWYTFRNQGAKPLHKRISPR